MGSWSHLQKPWTLILVAGQHTEMYKNIYVKILKISTPKLARPKMLAYNFGRCSIFNPTVISFEETSSYWSVQFVQFFSTFQTSYDSGILNHDYRIIQDFIGHH